MEITWSPTDDVALAVSGGVDSMVLLHMLLNEYKYTYCKLTLLHVNHGLREASKKEETYLKEHAKSHNTPIYIEHLHLDKNSFTQETARDARYQFFHKTIKTLKGRHLLTAHHKDDNLETIAHQIFSSRVPLGIQQTQTIDGIARHRPLINYRKSDLYAYADNYQVTYFEDESNASDDYTRNFLRNQVLSKIDDHPELSVESLDQLVQDYKDIETVMVQRFKHINDSIEIEELLKLTKLEQRYIIKKIGNDRFLSVSYIDEIIRVAQSSKPNATFTINNHLLTIAYGKIYRQDQAAIGPNDTDFDILTKGTYMFNEYLITASEEIVPVKVRMHQPADKMKLNFGTKKVSRIFIDEKVPKLERERTPIIENQMGEIIAVGTIYNIIDTQILNIERMTIDDT